LGLFAPKGLVINTDIHSRCGLFGLILQLNIVPGHSRGQAGVGGGQGFFLELLDRVKNRDRGVWTVEDAVVASLVDGVVAEAPVA